MIIHYKFYKWAMIIDLVMIGLLRFLGGTLFEYTNYVKVLDIGLYVIAIILIVIYLRKRSEFIKSDQSK